MLSTETVTLFFAVSMGLALSPGPDNVFVLAQSALNGRRAGLMVTLGLCTGLLVHSAAVAFGVAAVIKNTEYGFFIIKLFGAAYLSYLALHLFGAQAMTLGQSQTAVRSARLYRRGIVMNLTNPKVAIFFLAFLPQFTDPEKGSVTIQLLALGAVFIVATALVFGVIAWFSGFLRERLFDSPRAQHVLNRTAAVLFAALAVNLFMTDF
ncbi:LysE family translocator [Aequoribacter sp.]|uniref:LysE family translocator n=1 Tax=Aequoribacter sp. TaxID=2847771 RepID=UPI003C48CD4A